MSESSDRSEIHAEFKRLGENLKEVFTGLWDSEERILLQKDLESGLSELGESINSVMEDFRSSETGQQIQSDVEDLHGRIESGEFEQKARAELQHALDIANSELEKITSGWQSAPSSGSDQASEAENDGEPEEDG